MAVNLLAMASNLPAVAYDLLGSTSDGLQPTSDGLQPTSGGLQSAFDLPSVILSMCNFVATGSPCLYIRWMIFSLQHSLETIYRMVELVLQCKTISKTMVVQ